MPYAESDVVRLRCYESAAEALMLLVLLMWDYSSAFSGPSDTSSFNLQRRNGRRLARAMVASTSARSLSAVTDAGGWKKS